MNIRSLTSIADMARTRHDYIQGLCDISYQVITHLLRIWMYPDSNVKNHWKDEILAHLTRFCDYEIKRGSKKSATLDGLIKTPYTKLTQIKIDKFMSDVQHFEGCKSNVRVASSYVEKVLTKIAEFISNSDAQGLYNYIKLL